MKTSKIILLGAALLGLASVSAPAATVTTWNNTGTDWATGANWTGGAPVNTIDPTTGSIATFNTGTYTFAPTLASSLLVNGLAVGSSSGATVTLGGAFTLTVGSGGIDMSAAGANLTATTPTIALGAAQTWSINSGRTLSIKPTNAGNFALALTGPGTVAFGNNNLTGSGAITLSGGVLITTSAAAGNPLGSGALTVGTGGATITAVNDTTLGSSGGGNQLNGNLSLTATGGGKKNTLQGAWLLGTDVQIAIGTTTTAVTGAVSGTGFGITKTGNANLNFSSDLNSYTGTTTISAGSLGIGGTNTNANTATGKLSVNSAIVNNATLAIRRTNDVTQGIDFSSAAISGTGGLNQASNAGATLTLNAANTYSGSTTVSSGILKLSDSLAIQNSGLAVGASGSVVFDSAVVSNAFTVGGLSGAGAITLENNAGVPAAIALSVGNNTATATQSGVLSGAGSLIKIGSGEQILSADNTYFGTTSLNQGTLTLGAGGTTGKLNTASAITYGGGTLAFNRSDAVAQGTDFAAAAITGTGGVTQKGTSVSTVTLNAANTYTGATTVTSGKLAAGIASVLNTSGAFGLNSAVTTANTAGAVLDITGFDTQVGSLAGGGTTGGGVTLGSNTLTIGGNNTSTSFGGIISGTGGVVKIGTGTQTLTGANTFTTGGLTIKSGTVSATTSTSALGGSGTGAVTLGDSMGTATAALLGDTRTFANAITVQANVGANSNIIGNSGSTSTVFSGLITLNDDLTVASGGTGTVNLSGASSGASLTGAGNVTTTAATVAATNVTINGNNSGFTGNVTVGSGSLKVGSATALSSANTVAVTKVTGAVFDLNNFDQSIAGLNSVAGAGTGNVNNTGASTRTLTLGGSGTYDYSGNISPTTASRIALTKSGSGFQTLSGTNTFTGKTTISDGTLLYGQTASLYSSTGTSWTAANITVGSGATLGLNVGGTGEFTSANLNTLLTNISVANSSTTGLQAGAKLAFDTTNASGGSFTQGNAIANSTGANGGAIGLTKLGTNTLDLDKTNTYTGATTVSGGTLLISGTGSINSTSGVSVASGGTFRYNSSTAFTQSLSLASGSTLAGSGNLGTVAFTVASGSTLSPGNSPGTLSTGTQTWLDGGNYNFQLLDAGTTPTNAIAGTDYDTVAITGGLNLLSLTGSPDFNINLWTLSSIGPDVNGNALNFNDASNYSWILVSTTTGIAGFDANEFTINTGAFNGTSGFSNGFTGSFSVATAGNNLVLNYTAVPEPSTYALMGMGLGALWFLRRKSRKGV